MSEPYELHPHDLALLYDLADGRLAPRAAEELERRLGEEPGLRAAHDGLLALRRRLATLPTPALPADFLERVRARAGFPAAAPSADGTATANGPAEGDPRRAPVVAGRLLAITRFAYAAAAVVVVGLGLLVAWRGGLGPERRAAPEGGAETSNAAPRRVAHEEAEKPGGPALAASERDAAGPVPFRPSGAVAPGLRRPSDDPSATGPDARHGRTSGVEARGAEAPPVVAKADAATADAAKDARREADDATEPSGGAPDARARLARVEGGPVVPAEAFHGADRVLVVYADSLDAARAEVSLLVDGARQGLALDASRVARTGGGAGGGGGGGGSAPVVGAFVLVVDEASLDRLAAALPEPRADAGGLDDEAPGPTGGDTKKSDRWDGAPGAEPEPAPQPPAAPPPTAGAPVPAVPPAPVPAVPTAPARAPAATPAPSALPGAAPTSPTGPAVPSDRPDARVRRVRIVVLGR